MDIITIGSSRLCAKIVTLGAAVQDLRLSPLPYSLVLGLRDAAAYADNPAFIGPIVGPVANRIGAGRAPLGGEILQLDRNEGGRHMLHGGARGIWALEWDVVAAEPDQVTLRLDLSDGHMGLPGPVQLHATWRVTDATLALDLTASSARDTFCAPAPHLYFNLTGRDDLTDHHLSIAAQGVLAVDDDLIPTGDVLPAEGIHDWRAPRPLPHGLDSHFCIRPARGRIRPIAELSAPHLRMILSSTEAGLQVYDGAGLNETGARTLSGRAYGAHAGVALEPHAWVDAPNQPWRDQAYLPAQTTMRARTRFAFETIPAP